MFKLTNIFLLLLMLFVFNSPAFAEPDFYEENRPLTQQEVNIWRYKMERITIRSEFGKWEIIQGINTSLTDMQLLKLVNNENIATERLKSIEMKQNLGAGIALAGLGIVAVAALFLTNVIKIDNSLIYGIGGGLGGLILVFTGNLISPIISDEADHIINIDEARNSAEKYNEQLRKALNISDSIK